MWAMGDYALMAEEVMAPLGPTLVAAAGIGPGVRALDVAAGSGNISLPAAATGADVVSTDLTPDLLRRCDARAAALWGREGYVAGLLGDRVGRVTMLRRNLRVNRFDGPEAVHAYFKNHHGPTIEAYANIGRNRVLNAELDAQLLELAHQHLGDGGMRWEYLLVTAERR
jgi:hypothetical protein